MRIRYAYHPWHYYTSTLRTILEEGEQDYDPHQVNTISTRDFRQQCATSKEKLSTEKTHKYYKDLQSTKSRETARSGLYKNGFNSVSTGLKPRSPSLAGNTASQSFKNYRNPSINEEEKSRDMASRLFPEFFSEQLCDKNLVNNGTVVKTDADPLVDCWLGFYGRID